MTLRIGGTLGALELLTALGRGTAQMAYQTLQANNIFENKDYLAADEFTVVAGSNTTVNTGNSTALFNTPEPSGTNKTPAYILSRDSDEAPGDTTHDPDSFTNPGNAFDSNDATAATKVVSGGSDTSSYLGKTFPSEKIGWARVKATASHAGSVTAEIFLETFDGTTWTNESAISISVDSVDTIHVLTNDSSIQGIRLRCRSENGIAVTYNIYSFEYGQFLNSKTVETNSLMTLNSAPDSIVVYLDGDVPTGTAVNVAISDDGGTTFGVTGGAINSAIYTSSLSGTNLAIKLTLTTTDTGYSPKIYGYGLVVVSDQ